MTGNIAPAELATISTPWTSYVEAENFKNAYLRLLPLLHFTYSAINPVAVKSLMKALGLPAGDLRKPLTKLEGEALAKGMRIVQELGLDKTLRLQDQAALGRRGLRPGIDATMDLGIRGTQGSAERRQPRTRQGLRLGARRARASTSPSSARTRDVLEAAGAEIAQRDRRQVHAGGAATSPRRRDALPRWRPVPRPISCSTTPTAPQPGDFRDWSRQRLDRRARRR